MMKMPNFPKSYQKFIHKEISKEARSAARCLAKEEERPSLLDREALKQFSFNKYFDHLGKIAPSITTTLIAASSHTKYKDIKVTPYNAHCKYRVSNRSVQKALSEL